MRKGIIVFRLINIGSKSEGLRPFLYQGKGDFQAVWMAEDQSLEGRALQRFDGKAVALQGEMGENDLFLIRELKEIKREVLDF